MRRSILCLLLASALLLALAGCDDETEDELGPTYAYMPLDGGRLWDYVWDLPEDGDDLSLECTARDGADWTVEMVLGDPENQTWTHTADGELRVLRDGETNPRIVLKTPITTGTAWSFDDDAGVRWDCRIVQTDAVFDLPAGRFEDVVLVSLIPKPDGWSDSDYKENYWFAEDTGLIRIAVDDDDADYNSDWLWELNYVQE